MAVLISGEVLMEKVSALFKLREIVIILICFSLKVGNAFQRSVKSGYRKIIYRVIRKSEWGVYALGNKMKYIKGATNIS
jgi:hypothetical protein